MIKKKYLAAGILALSVSVGITSCSSDTPFVQYPDVEEEILATSPFTLVDGGGNAVDNLSSEYGEYFIKVNAEGPWKLEVDKDFLAPLRTEGEGPDLIPIYVGCNWSEARQGNITLHLNGAATRNGESIFTRAASQKATPDMEAVKKMISSNKGAGYSYQPNSNYCLGTNMQLFNLGRLDSLQQAIRYDLITDEYYPQVEEEVSTATSQEDLSRKLSVAASVNLNFNAFAIDVKGHYGSSSTNTQDKEYGVKRLKSYQFTREINYMNMVALVNERPELRNEVYAPGFIQKVEEFTKDIKAAGNSQTTIEKLCKDFCSEVGPCFISKSVMGCVLDYYISVDKSLLKDGMTAGGALEFKLKVSIGIDVKGEGDYSQDQKNILEKTEAKVNIRGGNVNEVCILATGGVLENEQVLSWQQSVEPSTAVMIDMKLVPIYLLINDQTAHDALKAYVDKEGSLDKKEDDK